MSKVLQRALVKIRDTLHNMVHTHLIHELQLLMKNIDCHISEQRMLQPSNHYSHLQLCTLRGFRMEKSRILALDS